MLKSWSISNFKPIIGLNDLQLAPVTVLAGLNSSGKSSLIQSILMIYQTLTSRVIDRPLVTNGPIIQLGLLAANLNEEAKSCTLEVGFELQVEPEKGSSSSFHKVEGLRGRSDTSGSSIKSIKLAARFSSSSSYTSAIEASKVTVENIEISILTEPHVGINQAKLPFAQIDLSETDLSLRKVEFEELRDFLANVDIDYLRLLPYKEDGQPNYLGDLPAESARMTAGIDSTSNTVLVALSHFLPVRFIRKFKILGRRRQHIEQGLLYALESPTVNVTNLGKFYERLIPVDRHLELSENIMDAINAFCRRERILPFQGKELWDWVFWLQRVKDRGSEAKIALAQDIQAVIVPELMKEVQQGDPEIDENSEGLEVVPSTNLYLENLESAMEYITRFFTSRIRYLGPLRADPQTPQQFSSTTELDDVGAKGEFAAAVYDANQHAQIAWYNPLTEQIEEDTLKKALNIWVDYLSIATEVEIKGVGRSEVSWQIIHKKGQSPRALSAVGVGVSQVLPILVMGLLSPRETLLIVEQPELHLHPHVQARLGDFFLGLSKCKKQCLIETHSEYLVNQLRYHIVREEFQQQSGCQVYFVDQNEQGISQFTPIEISSSGNILNWPVGFFDESMLQEDRIMAETIARRVKRGHL